MTSPPVKPDIVTRSVKLYPRLAITTHLLRRKNVRQCIHCNSARALRVTTNAATRAATCEPGYYA